MTRRLSIALPAAAFVMGVLLAQPVAAQSTGAHSGGVSMPQALSGVIVPTSTTAHTIMARPRVEVGDDVVRLGDLFGGLSHKAGVVVAHAPAPGEHDVFDHRRLDALARAHGIAWQPLPGGTAEVVVTRASEVVSGALIRDAILDALQAQGLPRGTEIELTSAIRGVPVAIGAVNPVGVSDISLDNRSGRFSAVVELPAGDPRATRLRVSGVAFDSIEIPVVTRPINRDAVIGDGDVEWIKVRADRLPSGVATDLSDVIGMAARRSLRAGDPLRVRDLGRPVLVARGELVTMIVRNPLMTLTSRGRALEDGGAGDVVRIRNDRSNKTVLGRIIDGRTVVVEAGDATAALTN